MAWVSTIHVFTLSEHVGIIQSLITTCKLHDINPYIYLTDDLQRISEHPASEVADLTPGVWKKKFAANPLRSITPQNERLRLDRYFGLRLPELVEVILCLDILGSRLNDCL